MRFALLLCAGLCPSLVTAAEGHSHGRAQLRYVFAKGELSLSLSLPAEDLLGFERAPRTPAEDALWQETQAHLSALLLAPECHVQSQSIELHLEDGHGEIEMLSFLTCPQSPEVQTAPLFDAFPSLEQLEIEGLLEGAPVMGRLSRP